MTDLSKGEFGSGLEKPAETALQYQSASQLAGKLKARMDENGTQIKTVKPEQQPKP